MVRKRAGLGERHQKILDFLNSFQEKYGYSPSIRQIGKNIGVDSTSLVDYYLKQLADMGLIDRDQHVSRSIRVTNTTSPDIYRLPMTGRIFASSPIPLPPSDADYFDPESTVEIARSLLPKKENVKDLFALEVQGDSMIDAMVNDGDIVIMKQAQDAKNGEMVAVWLDDTNETTLKYFYKEKDRVRLQPANPTLGPIYIENSRHLRIMGKVVMVIRKIAEGRISDLSPLVA
jgi:repressor LexA